MAKRLRVDRAEARPVYRQIADQLEAMIRAGTIAAGGRLPTVRDLALELKVTLPTVHRAFSELRNRGLIEATVGRGTFARGPAGVDVTDTMNAARGAAVDNVAQAGAPLSVDEVMSAIWEASSKEGVIQMAGAEPDDALLAAEEFWDCLLAVRGEAARLMRYQPPQGDRVLREALASLARERGISASPDDILVTSGVTHALSLALSALARPGDAVAVEEPTYLGLLGMLRARGVRAVGIPLGPEGPDIEVLERVIARDHPRFFYTIPAFQNPTGLCSSAANRRSLLDVARRHRLLVLEDDIYHRLAYDHVAPAPLRSADEEGLVVYLDGFSKAALPGARVGYIVAPRALRDRLIAARRADDLCGAAPMQRALAEFLRRGLLKKALRRSLRHYRARRDALMSALEEAMPKEASWTLPSGGFSCWLTLPAGCDARGIYRAALARGLAVTPGEVFFAAASPRNHLRLCFSGAVEADLRRGAVILGKLVHERREPTLQAAASQAEWNALV